MRTETRELLPCPETGDTCLLVFIEWFVFVFLLRN